MIPRFSPSSPPIRALAGEKQWRSTGLKSLRVRLCPASDLGRALRERSSPRPIAKLDRGQERNNRAIWGISAARFRRAVHSGTTNNHQGTQRRNREFRAKRFTAQWRYVQRFLWCTPFTKPTPEFKTSKPKDQWPALPPTPTAATRASRRQKESGWRGRMARTRKSRVCST